MMCDDSHQVGIYTQDGFFVGIWGKNDIDMYAIADVVHEAMIKLHRNEFYRKGKWIWMFSDDGAYIEGNRL